MTQTITIKQPDDWHLHVRDEVSTQAVAPHSARQFSRALVMPNLKPPVTTVAAAILYRTRILNALPPGSTFEPYMSLYLTDETLIDEVRIAAENPHIRGFKLYPAGATTNSEAGVNNLEGIYPRLEAMEKYGVVLQVHGEVTDLKVDIFDREAAFIDRHLRHIVKTFPNLRIVLEHVTTIEGAAFVIDSPANVAGTITAHHLVINRNDLLAGGIRPHNYCLPVAKREKHRQALLLAALESIHEGKPKFFLGTDSAPHAQDAKESACGCAGCFTAPIAIELCTEVFERESMDQNDEDDPVLEDWPIRLEQFVSFNGADFYGLPRNTGTITLVKEDWVVPESYPFGDSVVVPFRAGKTLHWKFQEQAA